MLPFKVGTFKLGYDVLGEFRLKTADGFTG